MKILLTLLFTTLLFLGCGGGGGSSSEGGGGTPPPSQTTGQFIDDKVQGLTYTCSSGTAGVTNANGDYTCNAGDDVTFKVGVMTIGTLAAQAQFFTPPKFKSEVQFLRI